MKNQAEERMRFGNLVVTMMIIVPMVALQQLDVL
jgi:hypothetical protein